MSPADRRSADPRPWSARPHAAAGVDLTFDLAGLRELRSAVAAYAGQLGAPEEQIERLIIVASELATNAIRHGGGRGRMRVWHHAGTLYCQVTDCGPGIADPTIGTEPPDPVDTEAHRGLWICRTLSQDLGIEANPDGVGVTVTATIARAERG